MSEGVFDDEEETGWTRVEIDNWKFWAQVSSKESRHALRCGFDLKEGLLAWMDEHVGPKVTMRQFGVWRNDIPISAVTTNVYFKDHNKAILFKLTWG